MIIIFLSLLILGSVSDVVNSAESSPVVSNGTENEGEGTSPSSSSAATNTNTSSKSGTSIIRIPSSELSGLIKKGPLSRSKELISSKLPDLSTLLFVSTLEGQFYAANKHTGEVNWLWNEDPVLRAPMNLPGSGQFLPDPKDGSLYMFQSPTEGMKKLPFTIPELVAASPSRSSDGILYTGSKRDTW